MEEKKNNKGLVWLIVILIILVLGLVGYIVYDKILLENEISVDDNNITTTKQIVTENNNFKQIKETKNGIDVILEYYDDANGCSLIIGNKEINLLDEFFFVSVTDPKVELYDDFIIFSAVDAIEGGIINLSIFNYEGEKIFSNDQIIIDGKKVDVAGYTYELYRNNIKVVDNKIILNIGYKGLCTLPSDGMDSCGYGAKEKICSDLTKLKNLIENTSYETILELEYVEGKFDAPKVISSKRIEEVYSYDKIVEECK